jgi:hypothetical protein
MRLTKVYGYWNEETVNWLNDNCCKWDWYNKETIIPFRATYLLWDEEDVVAFKLRFGV